MAHVRWQDVPVGIPTVAPRPMSEKIRPVDRGAGHHVTARMTVLPAVDGWQRLEPDPTAVGVVQDPARLVGRSWHQAAAVGRDLGHVGRVEATEALASHLDRGRDGQVDDCPQTVVHVDRHGPLGLDGRGDRLGSRIDQATEALGGRLPRQVLLDHHDLAVRTDDGDVASKDHWSQDGSQQEHDGVNELRHAIASRRMECVMESRL